jgi:hypothetical protein
VSAPTPAEVGRNTVAALTAVLDGDDQVVTTVLNGMTRGELEDVVTGLAELLQGTIRHVALARRADPDEVLQLFVQETGARYA